MKKYIKRVLSLLLAIAMLLMTVAGCGKSKNVNEVVQDTADKFITRGEWITMLAKTFGLNDYDESTPYYTDIDNTNPLFAAVQSCRERSMLSADTTEFKENDVATVGFVASTAVLASGVDYMKYASDDGNVNTAIINCAQQTGICADISNDDSVLREGVDEVYAAIVLEAAQGLFLAYSGEEIYDVQYADGVIDVSGSDAVIDENGNLSMDEVAEVGSIIVCPPSEEYPYGHAVKVTAVSYNQDGKPVYETTEAEFAEVYEHAEVASVVQARPEDFVPAQGVTVVTGDSAGGGAGENETTALNSNPEFGFIDRNISGNADQILSAELGAEYETTINVDLKEGKVTFKDTASISSDKLRKLEKENSVSSNDDGLDPEEWDCEKFFNTPSGKKVDEIMQKYKDGKISADELKEQLKKYQNEDQTEKARLSPVGARAKYDAGWSITGTVKMNVAAAVAATVDVEWFLNPKLRSYSVDLTDKFEYSLTLEGKLEGEAELGWFSIPVGMTGASVKVAIFVSAEANGKISVHAVSTKEQKTEYSDGKTTKTCKSSFENKVEIEASIEISAGARVSVCLLSFNIVDVELSVSIKLEAKAEAGRVSQISVTESDGGSPGKVEYNEYLVAHTEASIYAPIVKLTVGTEASLVAKLGLTFTWTFISEDDIKKNPNKYLYKHKEADAKYLLWSKVVEIEDESSQTEAVSETETEQTTDESLTSAETVVDIGMIQMNDYVLDIKTGDSYTITVASLPSGYSSSDLVWTSSDSSVAQISSTGVLKAVSEGTATITVKTSDGQNEGKCTVFVR